MVTTNDLSLPTPIDGEFEAFQSANQDNNNDLNNINDYNKMVKQMRWIASINRHDISQDVLNMSLLNRDNYNNITTRNMLNDTGASIQ